MRLTAKSEYGLLALVDIASRHGEGPTSAREISERQKIPAKFLEQVLVALRRAGIVSSVRGAHGGFELRSAPEELTVLEVVEALEGPLAPTVCTAHQDCERLGACAAAPLWERAAAALRAVLAEETLADLAGRQQRLRLEREGA